MMISQHFGIKECTRTDVRLDNTPHDHLIKRMKWVAEQILEPCRAEFVPERGFSPNSFFRSPAVNARCGGSKSSQHCRGEAVDFEISSISNFDLAAWVRDNLPFDQLILECYVQGIPSSGWVHVSLKEESNRRQILTYSEGRFTEGLNA